MLRRHALRVLRPHPARRGPGAVVAPRAHGLCDALHDQHAEPADAGADAAQGGQRGAQGQGAGAREGREQRADLGELAAHDHCGPGRRGAGDADADEWVCAAANGLRVLGDWAELAVGPGVPVRAGAVRVPVRARAVPARGGRRVPRVSPVRGLGVRVWDEQRERVRWERVF